MHWNAVPGHHEPKERILGPKTIIIRTGMVTSSAGVMQLQTAYNYILSNGHIQSSGPIGSLLHSPTSSSWWGEGLLCALNWLYKLAEGPWPKTKILQHFKHFCAPEIYIFITASCSLYKPISTQKTHYRVQ